MMPESEETVVPTAETAEAKPARRRARGAADPQSQEQEAITSESGAEPEPASSTPAQLATEEAPPASEGGQPAATTTVPAASRTTPDPMAVALEAGRGHLKTQTDALAASVTLATQFTQHWQTLFTTSLRLQQQLTESLLANARSFGELAARWRKPDGGSER